MDVPTRSPTAVDALGRVGLFHGLAAGELASLSGQVAERSFQRGELIFSQGDRGDGLYILTAGHVSISRLNRDGDELTLAVCEPGDYFGELALFDGEPRSADAQALDRCEALFLARSTFETFLRDHPDAMLSCLRVVVKELRRCTDIADEIALLGVRGRLARRLVRLAEQGVIADKGTNASARLRITQQQLANMTGATRESVNKHLRAMADDGLIRLERGHVEIEDLEELRLEG